MNTEETFTPEEHVHTFSEAHYLQKLASQGIASQSRASLCCQLTKSADTTDDLNTILIPEISD